MVDDRPEDNWTAAPDSGRPRRAPPTIDLEASEVSSETAEPAGAEARAESGTTPPRPSAAGAGSGVAARFCADFALGHRAGLRRGRRRAGDRRRPGCWAGRRFSRPRRPRRRSMPPPSMISPRASPALESKASKPAATRPIPPPPRAIEALEKSLAALRGELAAAARAIGKARGRRQRRQIGAARRPRRRRICPRSTTRIAQIERATRAQSAEIAQDASRQASRPTMCRCAASWRRRCSMSRSGIGDPYPAALAAAKSLAPDAATR